MQRRSGLIIEESITAALFVVIIFGLGIFTMSRWTISSQTVSLEEKRRLASCPHLDLSFPAITEFSHGFDAFYNDRFAFRKSLLATINLAKYKIFGYSSNPNVLVGKNEWLFFVDGGDEATLRGWPPLTHSELENWVRTLEERRAWLAARNIRYVVVIPPSKCTIYRSEVPNAFTCLSKKSRLDVLIEALKANSRVDCLDIREPMMQAKHFAPLYCKTDTHWNCLGAFVAYQELAHHLKRWFPSIEPLSTKDLWISTTKIGNGDMAGMMGLYDLIPETFWQAFIKSPRARMSSYPPPPDLNHNVDNHEPFATEINDLRLPRAFCLRDSFMKTPQSYLSENFRRIAYYWWRDFPIEMIKREKPDVVIEEFAERKLGRGVPYNPPELRNYAHVELFAERTDDVQLAGAKTILAN